MQPYPCILPPCCLLNQAFFRLIKYFSKAFTLSENVNIDYVLFWGLFLFKTKIILDFEQLCQCTNN